MVGWGDRSSFVTFNSEFFGDKFRWGAQALPDHTVVSLGLVPGVEYLRKFGKNDTISAANYEDVVAWSANVPINSSESVLSVVSNSTSDDVGQVGASKVTIMGTSQDGTAISEEVTLDGTTPVATSKAFRQVNRAYVSLCGSNRKNSGNITVTHTGTTIAYIGAGYGQTQQAFYTVPKDHKLVLMDWWASCGTGKQVDAHLEIFYPSANVWRVKSELYAASDKHQADMYGTIIDSLHHVKVTAKMDSTPVVDVAAEFLGLLVDWRKVGFQP